MASRGTQPRRIEIGLVEGDVMIVGGASQIFLKLHGTSSEDIVEDNHAVVRIARLPAKSELHIPSDVEVRVHEIAGDGKVFHVSERTHLGKVRGNLIVVDAPRGVLAEVKGDVVLDTSLGTDAEFVVCADANVTFRTYGEINARFVAQTSQGEIQTRLPLLVERGRRRNLVGVIGHGDATVTLRSTYGNITIIAADSDERKYPMNKEFTSSNKEHEGEGARTWEGGFGKHRFRARLEREPGRAQFHFQGPLLRMIQMDLESHFPLTSALSGSADGEHTCTEITKRTGTKYERKPSVQLTGRLSMPNALPNVRPAICAI